MSLLNKLLLNRTYVSKNSLDKLKSIINPYKRYQLGQISIINYYKNEYFVQSSTTFLGGTRNKQIKLKMIFIESEDAILINCNTNFKKDFIIREAILFPLIVFLIYFLKDTNVIARFFLFISPILFIFSLISTIAINIQEKILLKKIIKLLSLKEIKHEWN